MDLTIFIGSVMICQVLSYEYLPPNMGTVLYTSKDCKKPKWDKDDLALIQARMYAQQLVPPINTGIIVNEKYISTLMNYFREMYRTIKFESRDPRVGEIMTAAASDAIGGYMKSWMLPITKFAFYGGTLSKESARRVVNFYSDIRHFLGTDGNTWRTPDLEDLKYVAVTIAPPPQVTRLRFTTDPCKDMAFFEKSEKGLRIPIPAITWHDSGAMMFLPLKKTSIIALNSPTSINSLFQYYEIAKRCAKAANGYDESEFDHRFETWLITKVLPHLNDEKLYYGLNSVLSLVNKTHDLSDKIINLYVNRSNYKQAMSTPSYGSYMSKKVIIITVILFLEICWCIPAMFYMKLSKNRKKPHGKDNFLSVCVSYGDKSVKGVSVIGEVKRSKQKDDHGVKFQGQGKHRIRNKHSDPRKKHVYNNPPHLSKRANLRLDDDVPLICTTDEINPCTRNKKDFLKMDPVCISNASIETTSSSLKRHKNIDKTKGREPTKTVTLYRNTDPRKLFEEQNTKLETTRAKTRHSQVTILKDLPIVFQDPSKTSSIISTKITKILIAGSEEKGKFYSAQKQVKSHSHEKAHYKQNAITLSRKGTKSNVEKQFGIKIERQETDFTCLNSNEKTSGTKSSKGVCDSPKVCIREITTESDKVTSSSKQSAKKANVHKEKTSSAKPALEEVNVGKNKEKHEDPVDSSAISTEDTTVDADSKLSTTI